MQRNPGKILQTAVGQPAHSTTVAAPVRLPRSTVPGRAAGQGALRLSIDPLRVALFLMVLLTISRIHQHFPVVARLRPALILALGAAIYALINPALLNTQKLLHYWPAKVIFGLGIMACLSVPFGISVGNSATFILFEYSKILVFAFLLIAVMRGAHDLYLFIWAYVIASGLLVGLAWFVFEMTTSQGVTRLNNLYTWDANDAGCVLLTALPLTLFTLQNSRTGRGRIVSAIILVGIAATIARTGSRGAFLGGLVVAVALLFTLTSIPAVKRLLFVVAAGGALLLTAPPGYWEQMRTLTAPKDDYNWTSDYGRREVWKRGVGYMMSSPVVGIGIHNFQHAEGSSLSSVVSEFASGDRVRGKIKWTVVHNSFLQAGSEMGIPGFVLWTSLILGGIIGMRRLRRRLPAEWARGDPEERLIYSATVFLPISIMGFATAAFFLTFAYVELVYILAAYVTGVYVAADAKLRQRGMQARPVRPPGSHALQPAWRRQAIGRPRAGN